ncbi:N-acetylglucosamine-6-phosphate deacetylase [Nocardia arizonensis]|uniref:N-acetylglucosamine-6-phosphate deacetylase n=1 Tax=Nocardia arizonensis TaxID=1141647 RepID=UPI0006D0E617|nr:amidohydrolase family protein [Nocardia arizonensis]
MTAAPRAVRGRVMRADRQLDDGVVTIEGERIACVAAFAEWVGRHPDSPVPEHAGTILPGLVDIHNHGGHGHGFDTVDPDRARAAARYHAAHGTTTVLAGILTAPAEEMIAQIASLREVAAEGTIGGIYAEGPYLSGVRCGAQDPRYVRDPDPDLTERLLDAGGGHLRVMTLAPELPGYGAVAQQLSDAAVTIALGHTDADYSRFLDALRPAGAAGLVTHLANAMPALHHRAPGPVAAALVAAARGSAVVELIGDGAHVDAGFAALVFAAAPGAVALVTDAMRAAGMPDGHYRLGPREVRVTAGIARLPDGALAGGTATLLECLRWTVYSAHVPLPIAVAAATAVPARAAGLTEVGDLRTGMYADLVIVDDNLRLRGVLRHGQWLT